MLKVLNIPRYIYNEFRNDFLSCHPERSSMHMHVSNKFLYDLYYRVLVEIWYVTTENIDLYLWSQLHWSTLTVILCAAYFGNLFWKQSCHLIVHKKRSLITELCYYCAQIYGHFVCLKLFAGNPRVDISSTEEM